MAEITARTAPAGVPTTNALADIPADLLGPIPAELRLGANVLLMQQKPAELGEVVTVVMRLRITREGKEKVGQDADAEVRHFRGAKVVASWLKGDPEPPNPEDDQPALFGDDESSDESGEVVDNVARPDFSDQR